MRHTVKVSDAEYTINTTQKSPTLWAAGGDYKARRYSCRTAANRPPSSVGRKPRSPKASDAHHRRTPEGPQIAFPADDRIRPTSDRLRESIFNLLMHGSYGGEHIIDRRVVDLCCGTGALGFEAISRGAAECIFVDQDKTSLALAKDNALHCGVIPSCQFLMADVARLPTARSPVSLVLMDAPYDRPLTVPAYNALRNGNWFEPGALFVVEQSKTSATEELPGAEIIDQRNYGKAQIVIYRC